MGESYQIKDQSSLYYFTFQVVGWADVFTRQSYRDIVIESLNYCIIKKELVVVAYVIMTNHLHCILRSNSSELSTTIRDFKKFTSKAIMNEVTESGVESRRQWLEMIFKFHSKFNNRARNRQFWTHENHCVELHDNEMIDTRISYIHQNPVRAGWVVNPEDYIYSSASNYADQGGILDVEIV